MGTHRMGNWDLGDVIWEKGGVKWERRGEYHRRDGKLERKGEEIWKCMEEEVGKKGIKCERKKGVESGREEGNN